MSRQVQRLECPECGEDAIPASGHNGEHATWTEDDAADCPGCGTGLVARLTGDHTGEWMEAQALGEEPSK